MVKQVHFENEPNTETIRRNDTKHTVVITEKIKKGIEAKTTNLTILASITQPSLFQTFGKWQSKHSTIVQFWNPINTTSCTQISRLQTSLSFSIHRSCRRVLWELRSWGLITWEQLHNINTKKRPQCPWNLNYLYTFYP